MRHSEIDNDIIKNFDYFYLSIDGDNGKKNIYPPAKWILSKKEKPIFNQFCKFNSGIGLIMGQKFFDKYIIAVDFDNKPTEFDKDICIIRNGIDARNKLYNKYKYEPNTVVGTTPTGGIHELYTIDEQTKNLLSKFIRISIDNEKTHIDILFAGSFLICSPSYYFIEDTKYEYKWINENINDIKPLPKFWLDILLCQTKDMKTHIDKTIKQENTKEQKK